MSDSNLKLHKFKKVSDHPDHVIMRHPGGHEIKIAKAHLSPKLRGEIAALPLHKDEVAAPKAQKLSDGGPIESKTAQDLEQGEPAQAAPKKSFMDKVDEVAAPGGMGKMTYPNEPDKAALAEKAVTGANQVAMGTVGATPGAKMGTAKDIIDKGPEAIQAALKALEDGNFSHTHPAYQLLDKALQKMKGVKFADGGEVPAPDDAEKAQNPQTQAPVTINIGGGMPAATPQTQAPQATDPNTIDYASLLPPQAPTPAKEEPQATGPNAIDFKSLMAPKVPEQPYGVSDEQWAASQQQGAQPPQASPQAPQQAQGGRPDPFGTEAYQQEYLKGVNDTRSGLKGQANAAGQAADKQAEYLQSQVEAQQRAQIDYQTHYKALEAERQALQQDIMNSHIDPNRYLGSQNTGERIGNAIGLILGGLGSGLTGGPNPAMQFIQSQIDRDISAQQADLGRKQNLLSANLHQFGNLSDATKMTQVMMADTVANQLKIAAAKAGSDQAKAAALQAAGQLEMQAAPVLSQIAMKRTLSSVGQGSGGGNAQISPDALIRALPDGAEKEAFRKELKEAQGMVRARDNLLSAFEQLSQINTVGNRTLSPLQTAKQVSAIKDPLVAGLSKETAGRFTEQDAGMLAGLFPAPGDSDATRSIKKTRFNKLISEKMNFPTLQSYGIDPSNAAGYNSQGENKLQTFAPVIK